MTEGVVCWFTSVSCYPLLCLNCTDYICQHAALNVRGYKPSTSTDRWLSEEIQNPAVIAFHHNKELILKSHQCCCLCLFICCSGWLTTEIWWWQLYSSVYTLTPNQQEDKKDHIKFTVLPIILIDSRNSIFKEYCNALSTHSTRWMGD